MDAALIPPAQTMFLTVPGAIVYSLIPIVGIGIFAYMIYTRLRPMRKAAPDSRWGEFGALAVGALLYEILRAIPFGLGWLISVLVTVIGLGAMYFALRERMRPATPLAPPAEAAAD